MLLHYFSPSLFLCLPPVLNMADTKRNTDGYKYKNGSLSNCCISPLAKITEGSHFQSRSVLDSVRVHLCAGEGSSQRRATSTPLEVWKICVLNVPVLIRERV